MNKLEEGKVRLPGLGGDEDDGEVPSV